MTTDHQQTTKIEAARLAIRSLDCNKPSQQRCDGRQPGYCWCRTLAEAAFNAIVGETNDVAA